MRRPQVYSEDYDGIRRTRWTRWAKTPGERFLFFGACFLLLVCVLLSLVVAGLALHSSTAAVNAGTARESRSAKQIAELQAQVEEVTEQSKANRAADAARLSCDQTLTQAVNAAFRDYVSRIGDLVVVISVTPPPPVEERRQAVGNKVDELDAFNIHFRQLADIQAKYVTDGRPLPCPIAGVAE